MRITNKPTNAHDALTDTLSHSEVRVVIYCQVGDFDSDPKCRELIAAWDGDVDGFSPTHVMRKLKAEGWIYRHNAENYGHEQWVCPVCLANEVSAKRKK